MADRTFRGRNLHRNLVGRDAQITVPADCGRDVVVLRAVFHKIVHAGSAREWEDIDPFAVPANGILLGHLLLRAPIQTVACDFACGIFGGLTRIPLQEDLMVDGIGR